MGVDEAEADTQGPAKVPRRVLVILPTSVQLALHPFLCPAQGCVRSFCSREKLEKHAQRHSPPVALPVQAKIDGAETAEWRYYCPESHCEYSFGGRYFQKLAALQQHFEEEHMECDTVLCAFCLRGFADANKCYIHERWCGLKVYCTCGEGFRIMDDLTAKSKSKKGHLFTAAEQGLPGQHAVDVDRLEADRAARVEGSIPQAPIRRPGRPPSKKKEENKVDELTAPASEAPPSV